MLTEEHVILVDSEDNPVGVEEKIRAHELGLLHRAFSIFIYRFKEDKVEFLLQQRHPDKYHCGGLWTNACCSHPRVGEDVGSAAQRRLVEELSFSLPLTIIGRFLYKASFDNGLTEHELDHVLVGHYQHEDAIRPNPLEISRVRWIEVDQLLQEIADNPAAFTPWFKQAFDLVLEELCYQL